MTDVLERRCHRNTQELENVVAANQADEDDDVEDPGLVCPRVQLGDDQGQDPMDPIRETYDDSKVVDGELTDYDPCGPQGEDGPPSARIFKHLR